MFRLVRFSMALLLLVWLGSIVTISFYVALSLFGNESGLTPNSSVAGEIISPLLHKMFMTGWLVIPVLLALHAVAHRMTRPGPVRAILISAALLFAAWVLDIANGTALTNEIHSIREELALEFEGGYHESPADHPLRARFGMLHGISQTLSLLSLALGLGSFFCVTQLIGEPPRARDGSPGVST